ncbi:hypothetical protein [Paenibacillus sp. N3.4]|uniref:hypothetical protein n=1 Tax=Paenibacillus sp. N3.4 TaxID=2603222 RepID=UPI0011C7BD16|nr:hypothetical protein [Paenibacillus sp. N3.4]TXK77543.1 hypothetical protein FU659_22345 [Paenibacillus sp. N3.4]
MCKVFVEYAIKSDYRESFIIYMQEWMKREGRLELLEGTDQKELFVEIWNDVTYEEYIFLKQERLEDSDSSAQGNWEKWVEGGKRKVHMWHFSQVVK